VCAAYDLDVERFWAARERHDERSQFDAFETGARTRYGDVAAVTDLPGPSGVVSNNHHTTVEFVLDFFDLADAFDTVHGRPMTVESLDRKKPDPHYLEAALDHLGAESALYVGDSESDVLAAERAGLDSAFVRRDHNRDEVLATDPTYETTDLHEVADVVSE
jgi:HAD superfamily hydrolase (TIGR01549 family)